MARIAVEESLTAVSEALKDRGYEVVTLRSESDINGCDCCVVTGQDRDVMGIQTTATKSPVIDATGMSADDVCEAVEQNL
ncbi:YkuS family protein [Pullulanibacillus sp. KACC 23026]|uniref:YkuS family protein n=1 Tax=Pullulanibacillus sp. KACC 23026 TaxID=3028315 RepID=UPI0023B1C408|nr:YkuS family protein [Pullulanibacillus sp. KACC 23026]WEG11771.1 YkuS family protein [Pullulanibacillus sp. KACC 23026]